jgi:3-oxoacyl-[acyl-carrier-protein] synthase II
MIAGQNGIRTITAFDTSQLKIHRAGQIENFTPAPILHPEEVQKCGRASHLAIAAVHQAFENSGFDLSAADPFRIGVSFGTTMGEPDIFDAILDGIVQDGSEQVDPELWNKLPNYKIANNIAYAFGLRGPNFQIPTACAAGNYAIGYAYDLLRLGRVDAMIAGGSDALSRIAFVGFQKLRAMSPDDVSPFDANRKGMMVGEGAAALLLERLSDAKRRGAVIYAEFLGYGLGCDAHKMSIPHPDGIGGLIALRNALQHAEILPDQIDYISAHGTGTRENDRIETQIIKTVLGSHAQSCSISSLKSMTGHCMGASSAIEAAACCLSLKRGILIPTINYTTPDPECDLDCIPNQAREKQIEIAVSNAYAFGGNTSSIVLQRFV